MRRSLIAALYALAALSATLAQERPKDTFESLWNDATAGFHKITEYDDYTWWKRATPSTTSPSRATTRTRA